MSLHTELIGLDICEYCGHSSNRHVPESQDSSDYMCLDCPVDLDKEKKSNGR